MPDLTGLKLGRYAITGLLGIGGMATVYKAFDEILDRDVAIKVIRSEAFPPTLVDQLLKRFEREAKLLARLKHAHIVKVYDAGEHLGAPYLVLEYLPKGTLKERLGQPTPYLEAVRHLLPVARALDYAHNHGVLHRDLKPANILMNEDDEPVLTDFGIARLLTMTGGDNLTLTGLGIGTPEYMAPEQGMGQEVDARADIYALGVVLYEIVTGRRPYTADTPMGVIFKHVQAPLPDPGEFVPGLPPALTHILHRSLAKRPADRFAAAADFADALEQLSPPQEVASSPEPLVDMPTIYLPFVEDDPQAVGEAPPGEKSGLEEKTSFAPVTPLPAPVKIRELPQWVPQISKRSLIMSAAIMAVMVLALVLGLLALPALNPSETPGAISGVGTTPDAPAVQLPASQTVDPTEISLLLTQAPLSAARPITDAGPTATALRYSAASTPVPEILQELSASNMSNMQLLARWGRGVITGAAWSPDGIWMAIPSSIGVYLYTYDAVTWQQGFLIESEVGATCAAFSPDDSHLLIGFEDGTLQAYHLQQGRLYEPVSAHPSPVTNIVYSPDGKQFASSGSSIRLWNTINFESIQSFVGSTMAFSPDGQHLAVGTQMGEIKLFSTTDGSLIETRKSHPLNVVGMAYFVNTDFLVSVSSPGDVHLFSDGSEHSYQLDIGPTEEIQGAAFSAEGALAVTGSQLDTVSMFSMMDGFNFYTVRGPVDWLTFSPYGDKLAGVSSLDNSLRVWTPNGAQPVYLKDFTGGSTENVLFLPDQSTLAVTGTDGLIYLMHAQDGRVLRVLEGHKGKISSLSVTSDGKMLASAGYDDRKVHVWDLVSGSILQTFETDERPYSSISKDGSALAIAAKNHIRVFKLPGGEPAGDYLVTDCAAYTEASCTRNVDFSPAGDFLAVLSAGDIRVWKLGEADELQKIDGRSMAFSPLGPLLAIGSSNGVGQLWDGARNTVSERPPWLDDIVDTIAFSPNGEYAAGGGTFDYLKIWRLSDGKTIKLITGYEPATVGTNIAFSSDGKLLAVGAKDGTVSIWGVPPND